MLILVFCGIAYTAIQGRNVAVQDTRAIQEARRLLVARQAARLEAGVVSAALVTPTPAPRAVLDEIWRMHWQTTRAMSAVQEDMRADPRAGRILADFGAEHEASELRWQSAMKALRMRRADRPAALLDHYANTTRGRLEALDRRAMTLSRDVAQSGSFNSRMMKINDLVWRLRVDAGYDRGNITRALKQDHPVSQAQRDQFLRSEGRIDGAWIAIRAEDAGQPPALLRAVNAAGASYFRDYRAVRGDVLRRLETGQPTPGSHAWLARSNPGLSAIMRISETVFDLTEAHARTQLEAANLRLGLAVTLMLVAVGLAIFVMAYLQRAIVRPLREITRSINAVISSDRQAVIPYEQRPDEIGEFARSLRLLRESNFEKRNLEAARRAADMANRVKSEFLANMSHELRTPLNAIIGFSDMMRAQMFGALAPRYAEYAALINQSGQHLLNLVSDILDLSKVEAGKWVIEPAALNLDQTVDYCLRMVSQRAENQGVMLVKDLPDAVLFADERACRQILLNLLTNAVKFSRKGGLVTVSAAVTGSELRIAVRDTGIGIPAADLPRIGNAFEQSANGAFVASEGTGLGLALVKSLMALHKGSFHIASSEGVGTTVTVGFPVAAEAAGFRAA